MSAKPFGGWCVETSSGSEAKEGADGCGGHRTALLRNDNIGPALSWFRRAPIDRKSARRALRRSLLKEEMELLRELDTLLPINQR